MVLSRVFSLLFGTTLFVLIWTMQDGNHSVPRVVAATELRTHVAHVEPARCTPEVAHVETAAIDTTAIQGEPVASTTVTTVPASDASLWMFAAEPEQIAGK